jgi:hypothetical protein
LLQAVSQQTPSTHCPLWHCEDNVQGEPFGRVDWQMPPWHNPLTQSAFARQCLPSAQAGQDPPPQSMSVSFPFLTVSVQVGGAQTWPMHTRLVQSVANRHPWPGAQGGHVPPPQSTSVSLPSWVPFEQGGIMQLEFEQKPL